MRQKADKLEKGKWYRDVRFDFLPAQFFLFEGIEGNDEVFSRQKGDDPYESDPDGKYRWGVGGSWYIPTQKDIEKYNLNETE